VTIRRAFRVAHRFHWQKQRFAVSLWFLVALTVPVVLLVLWTAILQLPNNVLQVSRTSPVARVLIAGFPQGWAFFTRSPQEEQMRVFAAETPLRSLDHTPYSEPRNAFGLDRAVRKQTAELQSLLDGVTDGDWHACKSDGECLKVAPRPKQVDNSTDDPTYCGHIVVIAGSIVTWGYRELVPETYQDTKAVALDVRCLRG